MFLKIVRLIRTRMDRQSLMIEISGDFIIFRSESLKDFLRCQETVHKHILFPGLHQHLLDLTSGSLALPTGYPPLPQLLMQEVQDEGLQSLLIQHTSVQQVRPDAFVLHDEEHFLLQQLDSLLEHVQSKLIKYPRKTVFLQQFGISSVVE